MALTVSRTAGRLLLRTMSERLARLTHLWCADLLALIPVSWRERWGSVMGRRSPLVVETDASGECREVGGSQAWLAPETVRSLTRERLLALRIDDTQILRRRLGLPPAAVSRLDAVLDMNLGTWTPFAAAEVYAAAHPVEEATPRPGATSVVELRCVPRPLVDERIAALHAIGLDPDAIELGDARFTLPRVTRKRRSRLHRRWLLAGLALLLLGQSIGAYLVLAGRQRTEIDSLITARSGMVAALRRRADTEKEALVRQDGLLKIAARLDEDRSVSRALQLLAAVLPQEAVLREIELGRDRAEGHVAILGAAGLDMVAILSKTGFYSVRDLSVLPANEPERKVFSAAFVVVPWVQLDKRVGR